MTSSDPDHLGQNRGLVVLPLLACPHKRLWRSRGKLPAALIAACSLPVLAAQDSVFGGSDPLGLRPGLPTLETPAQRQERFRFDGKMRIRYEGLEGQYRGDPTLSSSDHMVVQRTKLRFAADYEPVQVLVEVMDSRQYGADRESFLDNNIVNPLDFLQAHAVWNLGEFADGRHRLRVGRSTIDHGSRRLVARNEFRNTINSFTGIDWLYENDAGTALHVFWQMPTRRLPEDRASLRRNELELDDFDPRNSFYGYHYRQLISEEDVFEHYIYRLDEQSMSSARRALNTVGMRIHRPPAVGAMHYEVELVGQWGEVGPVSSRRNQFGHFHHFWLGYTFDLPGRPKVQAAWDYATGDRDPDSNTNTRFDTLFATRNYELGPTGNFGAVARSNFMSPELRFELEPADGWEFMVANRGLWLASRRDAWPSAGVQDPTGAAGRTVGNIVETQLRWTAIPDRLIWEIGGAYIFAGRFQKEAPNGRGQDTAYFYLQMTVLF